MDGGFDPRTTLRTFAVVAALATAVAAQAQPSVGAGGVRIDGGAATPDAAVAPEPPAEAVPARPQPAQEQLPLGLPAGGIVLDADGGAGAGFALDPNLMELLRVGGALVLVLGLALVARRMVVRAASGSAAGRPSGVLEILARYPVGRGQSLVVLKLGRRVVLVHQTGTAMRTLSEIADPDEVAALLARLQAGASGRDASRFRSVLRRADAAHDRAEAIRPPVVDLTRRAAVGGRAAR